MFFAENSCNFDKNGFNFEKMSKILLEMSEIGVIFADDSTYCYISA